MSVQRGMITEETVDGLAALREFAEIAKNPQAIIDAHETARKQMQLTEAEKSKLEEAHAYINKYHELVEDIEDKRQLLKDESEKLDNDKKDFEKRKSDAITLFKQQSDALQKERDEFAAYEEKTRAELKGRSDALDSVAISHAKRLSEIDARDAESKAMHDDAKQKREEAEKIKSDLTAKAEKVRKQLEGF